MRQVIFFALLVIFSFVYSNTAYAVETQLMSLAEFERVLEKKNQVSAYFETTVRGMELKRYPIELRGAVHWPGLKVIVFTTHYKIAAGMSGSPVYVDGKLLGAVAYSMQYITHTNGDGTSPVLQWGGIAPISEMVRDAHEGHGSPDSVSSSHIVYRGMHLSPIPLGNVSLSSTEKDKTRRISSMAPDSAFLNNKFAVSKSGRGSSGMLSIKKETLKAGMPIKVDLMEWTDQNGEITTISAVGTITYIDSKGRVYAFGHPFLEAKHARYTFRTCEIMGIVLDDFDTYKMAGRHSNVLGTIDYDSAYGIYGTFMPVDDTTFRRTTLLFSRNSVPWKRFDIRVAESEAITPLLMEYALGMIGATEGAPLSTEASTTELDSVVAIKGQRILKTKKLYVSRVEKFGPFVMHDSSYEVATEDFMDTVFTPLFVSNYKFTIEHTQLVANFIPGRARELKLAAYSFPNKVKWGENPVLELRFVSEDNSLVISKEVLVSIDWNNVEKPVYTRGTPDMEKKGEKVVSGSLSLYSNDSYDDELSYNEKQTEKPKYFLTPQDFLHFFSKKLQRTNQMIFARVWIEARDGFYDNLIALNRKDLAKSTIEGEELGGWKVSRMGMKARAMTIKEEHRIPFTISIPNAPSGYIFSRVNEDLRFEIVVD